MPRNISHAQTLEQLLDNYYDLGGDRLMGSIVILYRGRLVLSYKEKSNGLKIDVKGFLNKSERSMLKGYITWDQNILVRDDRPFPKKAITAYIKRRRGQVDTTRTMPSLISTPHPRGQEPLSRHQRTSQRVKQLEERFPIMKKATRHPKLQPWIVTIVTTFEVALALLFVLVILPFLSQFLPNISIPFPSINLPTIPLPTVDLPSIPFPSLPDWIDPILYWTGKTWPIWVALIFGIIEVRKKKKDQGQ